MVKRLVRYVCEVCGAIFDDEKMAKECEGQNVQPFKFEIKEKVILKGTLFPEKAEIIGRFRAKEKHQNVYAVKRTVGWGDSMGEQESVVSENDIFLLEEYKESISNLFEG